MASDVRGGRKSVVVVTVLDEVATATLVIGRYAHWFVLTSPFPPRSHHLPLPPPHAPSLPSPSTPSVRFLTFAENEAVLNFVADSVLRGELSETALAAKVSGSWVGWVGVRV